MERHACCTEQKPTPQTETRNSTVQYFRPDVDIFESAEELVFVADLPGSSAEGVQIDYDNGKLTLRAQAAARTPDDVQYLAREYSVADFYRTFEIREAVDIDRAKADYLDGVLTLRLPKMKAAAKKITVQPTQ